mgnify:CR=1 FL=1
MSADFNRVRACLEQRVRFTIKQFLNYLVLCANEAKPK